MHFVQIAAICLLHQTSLLQLLNCVGHYLYTLNLNLDKVDNHDVPHRLQISHELTAVDMHNAFCSKTLSTGITENGNVMTTEVEKKASGVVNSFFRREQAVIQNPSTKQTVSHASSTSPGK